MEKEKAYFKDSKSREWNLDITVGIIKKIRSKLSINLADVFDFDPSGKQKSDAFEKIISDPVVLIDVIYCICEDQAESRDIDSEQFGELFNTGEIIQEATDAFLQGILKFLPPAKRLVMQKILLFANRNLKAIQNQAMKILDDPETEKEISKIWKKQFMNTPES